MAFLHHLQKPVTVAVTGANGFIGSKIVDLLLTKCQGSIKKVVCFDIVSADKFFAARNRRQAPVSDAAPLHYHCSDITDISQITNGLKGADIVCHTAGYIDINPSPDQIDQLYKVNIEGTRTIIHACKFLGINKLLYTSSAEVQARKQKLFSLGFDDWKDAESYHMKHYSVTKAIAEKLVLDADGTNLCNVMDVKSEEEILRTCALRPVAQFGEHDVHISSVVLTKELQRSRTLPRIGCNPKPFHFCYVGNTAWAHVWVMMKMISDPHDIVGKCFLVTDNTPLVTYYETMNKYLAHFDYKVAKFPIPLPLVYYPLRVINWLEKLTGVKLSQNTNHVHGLQLIYHGFCSPDTAPDLDHVGYNPIYSEKESMERTAHHFKENSS